MITLEETLANQNNLSELCADRPLTTKEIFTHNAYYGIDFILKKYAGFPYDYPLKVVVPHGVVFDHNRYWEFEISSPLSVILCYPAYRQKTYLRASTSKKTVLLSASPFLYLLELLKGQPKPERKGTIFFPAHSTHHVMVQMDFEALAEELVHLDEQYKPITVCIYWKDFNLGYHLPFQKRGMRIVSAGHMFDPYFLFRFYHLCSMHYYSLSNAIGGHLFYSIKSGCSYFYLNTVSYSWIAEPHILQRDVEKFSPETERTIKALFNTSRPIMTEEQIQFVDYYLGAEYFQSAQELRHQFLHAEELYNSAIVAAQEFSRFQKQASFGARFKHFLKRMYAATFTHH